MITPSLIGQHDPYQNLIGNDSVKLFLQQMVRSGQVAHSLLFAGPDGVGKGLFAMALAQTLTLGDAQKPSEPWHHPDVHVYHPEGKTGMHSIETLRHFHDEVYMAPYQAPCKVFIIHDADRMLPSSANALLKTFEEPPLDSVIILLSSAPEHLLSTVLSRCRKVYFRPLSTLTITQWLEEHKGVEKQQAKRIAALARGSLAKAISLLEQQDDSHHASIVTVLARGKFKTYAELKKFAAEAAATIEQRKQEVEALMREELLKVSKEYMSATQKEALEKEIEGAVAMRSRQEIEQVFDLILSWYRDMHAILLNLKMDYMSDAVYADELEQAVQRGEIRSLEEVQKTISDSRLAIERFMPLSSCLEGLFLKLNFL